MPHCDNYIIKYLPTNSTKIPNSIQAGGAKEPVAATQPPTGGRAPGMEPIMVYHVVIRLLGV